MTTGNSRGNNEAIDKYREYLADGDSPKNHLKNPKNIFDSLNSTDTEWLKVARAYLDRKAHLIE